MKSRKKRDPAMQFLIFSFIGVLLFSIVVFSVLGIYMSRKSEKAISEIGEIYMSGMNQQMSGHFDTVILSLIHILMWTAIGGRTCA